MRYYRQLNPIYAMSFDLDDTLYDNRPIIRQVEQGVVAWLHQQHPVTATQSPEWWQALKLSVAEATPEVKHDVSEWRYQQIFQGLKLLGYDDLKAKQAAEQALSLVLDMRSDFEVPSTTHQVMASLAKKVPLIGITNGNVDAKRIGLSPYFQQVFRAGPDGRAKPYFDLFHQAQQVLNLPPQNILHVGDHLRTDVSGARNNGFMACWFNDQGRTLRHATKARVLPDVEIVELSELLELV